MPKGSLENHLFRSTYFNSYGSSFLNPWFVVS
jgi:hypothetical protein